LSARCPQGVPSRGGPSRSQRAYRGRPTRCPRPQRAVSRADAPLAARARRICGDRRLRRRRRPGCVHRAPPASDVVAAIVASGNRQVDTFRSCFAAGHGKGGSPPCSGGAEQHTGFGYRYGRRLSPPAPPFSKVSPPLRAALEVPARIRGAWRLVARQGASCLLPAAVAPAGFEQAHPPPEAGAPRRLQPPLAHSSHRSTVSSHPSLVWPTAVSFHEPVHDGSPCGGYRPGRLSDRVDGRKRRARAYRSDHDLASSLSWNSRVDHVPDQEHRVRGLTRGLRLCVCG
jgi:hypothetical protein